jgi:CBS domain-containing protein
MKAAEIMTRKVVTTTPDPPIEEVVRAMLRHRLSGVPVVDAARAVIGVVTEGDLVAARRDRHGKDPVAWLELLIAPGRLAQDYVRSHARKVSEVTTDAVVSVSPDTPLAEVVALMESRRVKRLPVIEDGRLVGIVSRADLLSALIERLSKVSAAAMSDAKLRKRVLAEIDKQPCAPSASIDTMVEDGTVELRGVITHERERKALRVVAENVPGVMRVRSPGLRRADIGDGDRRINGRQQDDEIGLLLSDGRVAYSGNRTTFGASRDAARNAGGARRN